jgi:hypothetical protein
MLAAERAKAAPDAAEEERLEEAIKSSRFRFSEANARVLELVVGRHPFLAREVGFHLRARSAVDSSVVASAVRTNSSSQTPTDLATEYGEALELEEEEAVFQCASAQVRVHRLAPATIQHYFGNTPLESFRELPSLVEVWGGRLSHTLLRDIAVSQDEAKHKYQSQFLEQKTWGTRLQLDHSKKFLARMLVGGVRTHNLTWPRKNTLNIFRRPIRRPLEVPLPALQLPGGGVALPPASLLRFMREARVASRHALEAPRAGVAVNYQGDDQGGAPAGHRPLRPPFARPALRCCPWGAALPHAPPPGMAACRPVQAAHSAARDRRGALRPLVH